MNKTTVGRVGDGAAGVYIGRPSLGQPWQWGNPFEIGGLHPITRKPMDRAAAIHQFELWLATSKDERAAWMRDNAHKLKGKHLKCFCKPLACHGDVLARYADSI